MPSERDQVIEAVKTLVATALPDWRVVRDEDADKPRRPWPGGEVVVPDGDPGEAEEMLGGLRYYWTHEIPVEFEAPAQPAGLTRSAYLDQSLVTLGQAIAANRTLGGLADWLESGSAAPEDAELFGAETLRKVIVTLTATYFTTSPLG